MSPEQMIKKMIDDCTVNEAVFVAAFGSGDYTAKQVAVIDHLRAGKAALETAYIEFDNMSTAADEAIKELAGL